MKLSAMIIYMCFCDMKLFSMIFSCVMEKKKFKENEFPKGWGLDGKCDFIEKRDVAKMFVKLYVQTPRMVKYGQYA